MAYFYAIFQAVELTQNVATDLERKKNDLAKSLGEKSRIHMYIALLKAIGHSMNQFFEKTSGVGSKSRFFEVFGPQRCKKLIFKHFLTQKKISRNFFCEAKVVKNMFWKLKTHSGMLGNPSGVVRDRFGEIKIFDF